MICAYCKDGIHDKCKPSWCACQHRNSTPANPKPKLTASVTLFNGKGKYYTSERWLIPENALTPADMRFSPDFRRISNGAVLIDEQEPWRYPHLFPFVCTGH